MRRKSEATRRFNAALADTVTNFCENFLLIKVPFMAMTASADLLAPPALMARWIRTFSTQRSSQLLIWDIACRWTADLFNQAVLDFVRQH